MRSFPLFCRNKISSPPVYLLNRIVPLITIAGVVTRHLNVRRPRPCRPIRPGHLCNCSAQPTMLSLRQHKTAKHPRSLRAHLTVHDLFGGVFLISHPSHSRKTFGRARAARFSFFLPSPKSSDAVVFLPTVILSTSSTVLGFRSNLQPAPGLRWNQPSSSSGLSGMHSRPSRLNFLSRLKKRSRRCSHSLSGCSQISSLDAL